jgi:hypothetical protein
VAISAPRIASMAPAAIDLVRRLESANMELPQVDVRTSHVIHAGMYARTIHIPAGAALTGALIKIPTVLILNGHATVFVGDGSFELCGYHVLPASAGRKQAFVAHADTDLTMIFPSNAKTVEEAEAQFTDETHLLLSRHSAEHDAIITGE